MTTCCVCGGPHHPDTCERAQRYVAECLPKPGPTAPPPRNPALAREATEVFRRLLDDLVAEDAAHSMDGWRAGNRAWHVRMGHRQRR